MAGNLNERAKKIASAAKSNTKGAPRSKRIGANNGPARQRYWASGRLEQRKIRNLMRHNGLTRAEAYNLWHDTRKGRIKR